MATVVPVTSMGITDQDLESEESLWDLYERWCTFNEVARDPDEKSMRFSIFKQNVRFIHENNRGDARSKLGLNIFADMTHAMPSYPSSKLIAPRRATSRTTSITCLIPQSPTRSSLTALIGGIPRGDKRQESRAVLRRMLGLRRRWRCGGHNCYQDRQAGGSVTADAHRLRQS